MSSGCSVRSSHSTQLLVDIHLFSELLCLSDMFRGRLNEPHHAFAILKQPDAILEDRGIPEPPGDLLTSFV